MSINGKHLKKINWPFGPPYGAAIDAARRLEESGRGGSKRILLAILQDVCKAPGDHLHDPDLSRLAEVLLAQPAPPVEAALRDTPVAYTVWGEETLDANALEQMQAACTLQVAAAGSLMPDGHYGYGLPIGGVLATRNAVIPYAVGVDIACRMKLTIVDVPAGDLERLRSTLTKALMEETAFGTGSGFPRHRERDDDVLRDPRWADIPTGIKPSRHRAQEQLGSSGTGNHFVEWGEVVIPADAAQDDGLGLPPGSYVALLSHSGSRALGARVCGYFSTLAKQTCLLPKHVADLAWLELDTDAGQAYWSAMELAGDYATANHRCIHDTVLRAAGLKPATTIENHHNFAWRETHEIPQPDGAPIKSEEVIVHRKGATPASLGELGIIPGTMADPGYIVRGKGNPVSLRSAAHGAGRRMSRRKARESISGAEARQRLAENRVTLLGAGIDEAPQAYKDIDEVMSHQTDLVDTLATFHPRIVRMADDNRNTFAR